VLPAPWVWLAGIALRSARPMPSTRRLHHRRPPPHQLPQTHNKRFLLSATMRRAACERSGNSTAILTNGQPDSRPRTCARPGRRTIAAVARAARRDVWRDWHRNRPKTSRLCAASIAAADPPWTRLPVQAHLVDARALDHRVDAHIAGTLEVKEIFRGIQDLRMRSRTRGDPALARLMFDGQVQFRLKVVDNVTARSLAYRLL